MIFISLIYQAGFIQFQNFHNGTVHFIEPSNAQIDFHDDHLTSDQHQHKQLTGYYWVAIWRD